MLKPHWIFLPLMIAANTGFSQSLLERAAKEGTVVSSTDPVVVADVERKAAEIVVAREQGAQQSSGASVDQTHGATSTTKPLKASKGKHAQHHASKHGSLVGGKPSSSTQQ